ncbi:GNAT family N-acetyltransferase [Halieaceae bacterium IMCC14734]|uniref:GNAT family N-acetyltransferase n=1 Tax=Candidatus Litorirhabdus singularis TaxID=2518993 RepID=A0ABT3TCI6_9GAMM|nr:GNAT family N-acetyltransferase [Candidatus Litorirhabdus singularis]MCX2979890.1 GNAT family N-acetyltransferase [Candidatus Litorirhabdus singularis]
MKVHSRKLNDVDFKDMRALLLEEGPNEWNYLTHESIDHQFSLIKEEKAIAVLAEGDRIVGFSVLIFRGACSGKVEKYSLLAQTAYINDVVVSARHSGKGLGCDLLLEAVSLASRDGCDSVYIERHEDNVASAGMMRKAGFEIVDTFHDPKKRSSGSRNTVMLCKKT